MAKESLEFDVHLPNLLKEMLNNKGSAILRIPVNTTLYLLKELAGLAIRIDNPELHIMMLRLGLYECSASERVEAIERLKKAVPSELDEIVKGAAK